MPAEDGEETGRLAKYGSIVLDSNGDGIIDFSVDSAWQRWEVNSIRVSTSQLPTQIPVPTVEAFAGYVSPGFSQGLTQQGTGDTLSGELDVDCGNDLHVAFVGGVPGTTAYARVYGTRYTRTS